MEKEKITPEYLKTIEAEIETHVGTERTSSRNLARKLLFEEFKEKLQENFPEALRGVDVEGAKYADLIKTAAEKVKAQQPGQPPKDEPEETPAQIKARLESENQMILKKEREAIRRKGVLAQILGEARAEGLDPLYAESFADRLEREYGLDVSKDEVQFVRNDEPYYINGKPATATDVVRELFGKYTAFKKTTPQTPDPNNLGGGQPTQGQLPAGDKGIGDNWEADLLKDMPGLRQFQTGK